MCHILPKLAATYLRGSSTSEAARTLVGVGLRLAQDIGAHRKKMYATVSPVEGETLKRAFWYVLHLVVACAAAERILRTLVWLDWALSPQLGRPCGVQFEE